MASQMRRLLVTALRSIEKEAIQSETAPKRPKSREGKKTIVGHFVPEAAWQLKKLALDRQMTVQGLLEEALGDLFEKYHLPKI
jgi:hypothetical protein